MKHFASLLGARGIRVNAVAPGVVETDISNFTKTDAGRDFALGGARSTNAVWTYESPYAAVAAIKDYLAFYPDRVDAIEERSGG